MSGRTAYAEAMQRPSIDMFLAVRVAVQVEVAREEDLVELLDADPVFVTSLGRQHVAARLLALPGIGPYGTAHMMMLLGRHSRLVLDSWTRPKYAQLVGRSTVPDKTIARRFRRYGRYAGLAFWLFLTRDWVADPIEEAPVRLSAGEPGARRR